MLRAKRALAEVCVYRPGGGAFNLASRYLGRATLGEIFPSRLGRISSGPLRAVSRSESHGRGRVPKSTCVAPALTPWACVRGLA